MRCASVLVAAALVSQAANASAITARDAADCAAFSYANWDYELQHFDAVDRSPQVKQQAAAFQSVAIRLGLDKVKLDARVNAMRPVFLETLNDFIFSEDAGAEVQFVKITTICNSILDTAPEMAAFR